MLGCAALATEPAESSASPEADFAARCGGPGVIVCNGFDSLADVRRGQVMTTSRKIVSEPLAFPANRVPGGYYPSFTAEQSASGAGSLVMPLEGAAGPAQSGGWRIGESGGRPWPVTVAPPSPVYIQFRMRFDATYAGYDWNSALGRGGNKHFILWSGGAPSCTDLQFVLTNAGSRGFPQTYSNCGKRLHAWCSSTTALNGRNCVEYNRGYPALAGPEAGSWLYQSSPGGEGYTCWRGQARDGDCALYRGHAERWWTFYFEIFAGPPGDPGSRVAAFVSRGPGEGLRQFVDFGPWPWAYEEGAVWANFLFTQYRSSKRGEASMPDMSVWYDELIISTRPIPPPADLGQQARR